MKLDLPVMIAALLVAAALQDTLPGIPCPASQATAAKVQLLPAVALYYILDRPWQMALCAALWAGLLTDALGFLPAGTTTLPLLISAILGVAFRDATKRRPILRIFFEGTVLLAFVFASQRLRMALASIMPLSASAIAAEAIRTIPPAAIFATVAFQILSRIDLLAENVSRVKGGEAA